MKKAAVVTGFFLAVLAAMPAQSQSVTHVDAHKVSDALANGGQLVTASDLLVSANHRAVSGQVEVHARETDVFYIVEGSATFVTGGTVVDAHETAPGQIRGTAILDGQVQTLVKGDVMVIPAGIPHWFKAVSPGISYFTVKVLKP